MEESLSITTKGGDDTALRVRTALAALNGGLAEKREDVRLLATELLSNAVRHAGAGPDTLIHFELAAAPERIRAKVVYPGAPFEAKPSPDERKFGLFLVDDLSDRWGVERTEDRNRVWFEIDR
jgi:anti-sigma regulatory factor (Ser/Thr protein kinase)